VRRKLTMTIAAIGITVLILDARTALLGAQAGIHVCVETVVPSLFPFFVLTILLNTSLMGQNMDFLSPLARFLRIPKQAMPVVMVGLLGGYPVGAQMVTQAFHESKVEHRDAVRMLAFCSNAGPAFLFGIGTRLFPKLWICFLVWAIHIISAWIVALLTPGKPGNASNSYQYTAVSLPQALQKALHITAVVCGWVVLFRILLAFADRWFLWAVSEEIRIILSGVLELANGCCALSEVKHIGFRLTAFSALLSFGGICVAMQTASVCDGVSIQYYLPGKLTQAAISVLLCWPVQMLLQMDERQMPSASLIIAACTVCVIYRIFAVKCEKRSRIFVTSDV